MQKQTGRTFWDFLSEHKLALYSFLIILVFSLLTLIYLLLHGYKVNTPVINIESQKTKAISPSDSIEKRVDTIVIPPKTVIKYKDRLIKSPAETIKVPIPNVSVTSTNQSGGITANEVYLESKKKILTDDFKKALLKILPNKSERININHLNTSSEGGQIAVQIRNFLKSEGYQNVPGVGIEVRDDEFNDIQFNRRNNSANISVGNIVNSAK